MSAAVAVLSPKTNSATNVVPWATMLANVHAGTRREYRVPSAQRAATWPGNPLQSRHVALAGLPPAQKLVVVPPSELRFATASRPEVIVSRTHVPTSGKYAAATSIRVLRGEATLEALEATRGDGELLAPRSGADRRPG